MVDSLCYLGIYPDEIRRAQETFDDVCDKYDLGDLYDDYEEYLKNVGDFGDITNSIMGALFDTLMSALKEKGIDDCDYYVNGLDTHFYINHEEV